MMLHEDHVTHAAFSRDGRWVATACRDGSARIWDAATGEPLTPRLPQRHPLRFVQFVDRDRVLLTVTETGETCLWPLPKETRSAEEWVKIGELLSAQQSLATDALRQLWNQLRARYPDEFSFR